MKRYRMRFHGDAGMSLVELMVASLVSSIVVGLVVSYVIATGRIDRAQENDLDALDEMQFARVELIRDLRFARSVSSPASNQIDVWIDLDGSGGTGPDQTGEEVTWVIDGTALVRYEDGNPAVAKTWADDLDDIASSLVLDGTKVSIVLASNIDRGFGDAPRTLVGSVTVRNAS